MRLLLALDLHDHPEELVAAGVTWARRLNATLDLIYVAEEPLGASMVRDPAVRTVIGEEWGRIQKEQLDAMRALQDSLPPELRGGLLVRTGQPAYEIVEAARDRDAVLVGTHGRRGLLHVLLGSVAERVIRVSPVPVVVLPVARADSTPSA